MSFSDTMKRVIELTAIIRDYWDRELRKRHPDYPIVKEGVDDGPPPPEEAQLRDLLRSLSRGDLYKLLAIASLGRGEFQLEALESSSRQIAGQFPRVEDAIDRLMSLAWLDADLTDAQRILTAAGIGLEHLEPSTV